MISKRIERGERIIVAMSGGVDSSLAAALLKKEGYGIIGVTFKMWPKEVCGASSGRACCSLEAITRARAVAEGLGIPYYVVDFSEDFKKEVIDYFCSEYLKGLTPNPCVVCNEKIKFGKLLDTAKDLGVKTVATGHYANVDFDKGRKRFLLKEGRDKRHDQSYFLFSLSQGQLGRAIFPLGGITKDQARKKARQFKLRTYDTASSQDVCFIRDAGYAEYIRKETGVEMKTGDIVDGRGRVLGRHKGIPFYTIGQRRGLGIAHAEPLYVIGIDIAENRVIAGTKKDVLKKSLVAHRVNWISVEDISSPIKVTAKVRYGQKKAEATVTKIGEDAVRVEFSEAQEAPAPGQAVVFYDGEIVVGGGWIAEVKE